MMKVELAEEIKSDGAVETFPTTACRLKGLDMASAGGDREREGKEGTGGQDRDGRWRWRRAGQKRVYSRTSPFIDLSTHPFIPVSIDCASLPL
jgi:hypothetical protein